MLLNQEKITAEIGGILITSYERGIGNEFMFDDVAITGWLDGVGTRRAPTARLTSPGDFPEPASLSSRLITLTGLAKAKNPADLQVMRDKFTGILIGGGYTELQVSNLSGSRFATVGLEGTTSWTQTLDSAAAWKLDLYAPDPHIYGELRTVNIGSVSQVGGLRYPLRYPLQYNAGERAADATTLDNRGNAPAWPIVRVTGEYASGFSLTDNLGRTVTYRGMVTLSAPVEINMQRGTATQSGVDKSTLITQREWFSVPPNSSIRPAYTPFQSGYGWCDIMIRDTWI